MKSKNLRLDLDSLSEYFYTEYGIGGAGHSITIKAENKEKFLDAFAKETRDRVESMLEEEEEEE